MRTEVTLKCIIGWKSLFMITGRQQLEMLNVLHIKGFFYMFYGVRFPIEFVTTAVRPYVCKKMD